MLPWDAVGKATSYEYFRKSRYFLAFAGYLDPKMMLRRSGPNFALEKERREIKKGMERFIRDASADPKAAKAMVLKFITAQKERMNRKEIGPEHLKGCLKPVKLALDLNEVALPWKNMMRLVGNGKRSSDREYKVEEIRQLMSVLSQHLKVAVLLMSSSGIRIGAFEYLNVGHIQPLEVNGKIACGKMLVYAGEGDDEYETLISKEAYVTFQEYVHSRKDRGEEVTKDSPALVVRKGARRCSPGTIRNSVNDFLWKAGLRKTRQKRYDVQVDHGFRKFFDNVAKDYIDEAYVEKLIGHRTGTKEHYDRHLPKPAIEQYLRAMPHLSINPAYRAEAELTKKLDEMKKIEDEGFTDLRLRLLEKDSVVRKLEKRVEEQDVTLKQVQQVLVKIQRERERELRERTSQQVAEGS